MDHKPLFIWYILYLYCTCSLLSALSPSPSKSPLFLMTCECPACVLFNYTETCYNNYNTIIAAAGRYFIYSTTHSSTDAFYV